MGVRLIQVYLKCSQPGTVIEMSICQLWCSILTQFLQIHRQQNLLFFIQFTHRTQIL